MQYQNLDARGKLLEMGQNILHKLFRQFIRSKKINSSFFLGINFCLKVHFTL